MKNLAATIIFSYGFLFLHLGIALRMIRNKLLIHSRASNLTFMMSSLCLFGSYMVANDNGASLVNMAVFCSLVLLAPLGLYFLVEVFGAEKKWHPRLLVANVCTAFLTILGLAGILVGIEFNLVIVIGYLWIIITLVAFAIFESKSILPINTLPVSLKRFMALLFLDLIFITGMMVTRLINNTPLMVPFWFLFLNSLVISVMVIIRDPNSFLIMETAIKERRYERSRLDGQHELILSQILDDLLKKDRIFLDPELRLPDLARAMKAPHHQVSELINQKYSMSYNQLINTCRVQYACQLLQEDSGLSILDVAFQSGFNSKSSFNASFKSITGMTPSQYVKGGTMVKGSNQ